jgi:glucuronate isomerase
MSALKLLSRTAVRAASTSTSPMTKTAGDISSVFPSLRPDYQPEPLPPRFKDLKQRLFEKNEKALVQSWKRLLESLEKEVHEIKAKGSDVRRSETHCIAFTRC